MENDSYLQDQEKCYSYLKKSIKEAYREFQDTYEELQKITDDFPDIDIKKVDKIRTKTIIKSKMILWFQKALCNTILNIKEYKNGKEED